MLSIMKHRCFECASWVALAFISIVVTACAPASGGRHERVPKYEWGFYNAGERAITDVHITFGDNGGVPFGDGAGLIVPDAEKGSGSARDPIPETAAATWTTPDGMKHHKDVPVAALLKDPKGFSGIIYFRYTADDVQVIPIAYDDWHREVVRGTGVMLAARAVSNPATRPTTQPVG